MDHRSKLWDTLGGKSVDALELIWHPALRWAFPRVESSLMDPVEHDVPWAFLKTSAAF
jgi:hypothetical protein